MLKEEKNLLGYRRDIDGLRAIAVVSVIAYHFGFFPNGYLGVDVFFVISGYLITKILVREVSENRFSILQFYLRRTRRIIPLVLFVNFIALAVGVFVMLPDDLENLSQSVVATNLFGNNILQLITTRNYWDVINEYKPLVHTWSLGVEEQFYVIYPLLFLAFGRKWAHLISPLLFFLTLISLFLFIFSSSDEASKFYLIQFRFFELSLGGLGAIVIKDNLFENKYSIFFLVVVVCIMLCDFHLSNTIKLCTIVIATLGVIISANNKNRISSYILENKVMVGIGKISFSLYMWHQIVLAFSRYFILENVDNLSLFQSIIIFLIIFLLSIFSYLFIEQPFRYWKRINTAVLILISSIMFIFTTSFSLILNSRSGVIRDVPELGIARSDIRSGLHSEYNSRIYELNKNFSNNNKIKILIIGNSFARDWANVLLESDNKEFLEISYTDDIENCKDINQRLHTAKYVFFSEIGSSYLNTVSQNYKIDSSKIMVVGTKNFGKSNGIYYNRKDNYDYCFQRTQMQKGFLELNTKLKKELGDKYIDLIGMILNDEKTVPVFTPECKFISSDGRHLTKFGARYFSEILRCEKYMN
jgi:peptidoglycan/LPS O-acetylase OafA/YrhL